MNLFRHCSVRLPVIALAAVGWLTISNHCLLAAIEGAAKMPMPSCHGGMATNHSPAKPDQSSGVECCKILRATLSTPAKNFESINTVAVLPVGFFTAVFDAGLARLANVLRLDTGPPDAPSFSELVLQRSVLAHAPPFLA